MDSNGYNPSIMDTEDGVCYLHKADCETVRHEIYGGNGGRKMSKANGFWVNICPFCHRIVHKKGYEDKKLKLECEIRYLSLGHTVEDFISLVGRNYED